MFKAPVEPVKNNDSEGANSQLPPLSMFKPLGVIAPLPKFGKQSSAYETDFEDDNTGLVCKNVTVRAENGRKWLKMAKNG